MEYLTQEEIITIFMKLDAEAPSGYYSKESRDLQNRLATNNVKIRKLEEDNSSICKQLQAMLKNRN